MVTGPNMGGKSSTVRMVALICVLGQVILVIHHPRNWSTYVRYPWCSPEDDEIHHPMQAQQMAHLSRSRVLVFEDPRASRRNRNASPKRRP